MKPFPWFSRSESPHGAARINFLGRADNLHTIRDFVADFAPGLHRDLSIFTYEELPPPETLPAGLWIFADVDRLTTACHATAVAAWETLRARHGRHVRLLNRPGVSLPRRPLLERLHALGRNRFAVHGADAWAEVRRFPVFVRRAAEHTGALTPLLDSPQMLADYLGALRVQGHDPDDLLIVEYLDTGANGAFRKYSAFRAGDTILAHHIFTSQSWHVKATTLEVSDALIADERAFQRDNPHLRQLREIFALAAIEFGRIDYALHDGEIQVWEINTNPTILDRIARYRPAQLPAKHEFAGTLVGLLRAMARATL